MLAALPENMDWRLTNENLCRVPRIVKVELELGDMGRAGSFDDNCKVGVDADALREYGNVRKPPE